MAEIGRFLCRTAQYVSHRILNTFPSILLVLRELSAISAILIHLAKIFGEFLCHTSQYISQRISRYVSFYITCAPRTSSKYFDYLTFSSFFLTLRKSLSVSIILRHKVLALLFLTPLSVWAVDDTFTVSFEMDPDTTPPSIPLNLLASPISFDQIDLSWDAATDNHAVYGYQIFRDGVQIATTSSSTLVYSDSPLQQVTTYSYNVTAFDISDNVSAKSATSTTITYPASSGDSVYSSNETLEVDNWQVETTENSITITFTTDEFARAALRWGETNLFEEGYTAVEIYRDDHRLIITGLDPDTAYNLDLFLKARFGGPSYQDEFIVRTASGPDKTPPQNVMNFAAIWEDGATLLSWVNPPNNDFDRVRIVGSTRFYPADIADGYVVYEGSGEKARDVWGNDGIRYYSAFAIDDKGNVSSGAVAVVKVGDYTDILNSTPIIVDGKIIPFAFSDLVFVQQYGSQRYEEGKRIVLYQGEATKVALGYDVLPEHLKTIVVTLSHPDGESSFSFLLKVDEEKEWYEAVFGSLPALGEYDVKVEVYNYKTKSMTRVNGAVTVLPEQETGEPDKEVILPYFIYTWAGSLLFLLLSLLFYQRRRREV
ncbi:hypothetical protein CL653_02265 [bacterium]|nr:hypothetical protein [bacterium]